MLGGDDPFERGFVLGLPLREIHHVGCGQIVGPDPPEADTGQADDLFGHVDREPAVLHAAPSHVDLDREVDRSGHALRRSGDGAHILQVVHPHRDIGPLGQIHKAGDLSLAHDLVRDEDTLDPCPGKNLRFFQFLTGHPNRPRIDLLVSDDGGLVRLHVRAQIRIHAFVVIRHLADVVFHRIQIDQQRRCIQV